MNARPDGQDGIRKAREIVADLFEPNPLIYWLDLVVTAIVAYSLAITFLNWDLWVDKSDWFYLPGLIGIWLAAGFGLFRMAMFMHEVTHFKPGRLTGLKVTWNLIGGVPLLMPSFLYGCHLDHHSARHYGTGHDGEYLPLGGGRLGVMVWFFAQVLLLPFLVFIRFLIIGPISFLHPKLRRLVLERMSSFVINFHYRREIPRDAPRKFWALMECLCFLRAAGIVVFVIMGWGGIDWTRFVDLYLLAVLALGLDRVRETVAHRYRGDGNTMSQLGQLADSVNITGKTVFTELMFPLGMRYHALHHMFPSMPHHNLGTAHRRLLEQLPEGSFYHQVKGESFWHAVRLLIKNTRHAARHPPRLADQWFASRNTGG